MPPKRDWRPLPKSLVVVAFPTAYRQSPLATPEQAATGDFFIVQAAPEQIELPLTKLDWLTLSQPEALSAGMSRVDYRADDNTVKARRLSLPVTVRGQPYRIEFAQQPGLLVQDEMTRVLNTPLTIDFQVAIGFVADLIKKIPIPPIRLLVALIAILAIVALSLAMAALRHAFVDVPEPKPLSTDTNGVAIDIVPGVSVTGVLPLADIAAEDQTIALQTVKEIYWLVKQIA